MKESGIDKLIELLNEYEKKRIEKINSEGKLIVKLSFRPYTEESLTNKAYRSCWLEICSKYYGFIKHLIDNDKIDFDFDKIYSKARFYVFGKNISDTDYIIMILSIQDNPIDFLINILK